MNEIELQIANLLNLNTVNLDDVLGIIGAALFFLISLVNLKSDRPKKLSDQELTDSEVMVKTTIENKDIAKKDIVKKDAVEKDVIKKPVRNFSDRLKDGLAKTRNDIWGKVGSILSSNSIDEEQYDTIEEILFSSDLSPRLVDELLENLKKSVSTDSDYKEVIKSFLKEKMQSIQSEVNKDLYALNNSSREMKVIMIVGVNGAGKTTTIGKLATKLKNSGAKVVVGACDTFRAAAVEQLEVWCQRAGVEIVKAPENADPSGVAFDTVKRAKDLGADYCIIDTAGRLHTASNLMDELAKTKKVMSKVISTAPDETLLVIDAITGQNALRQAQEFNKSLDLSGLVFTKCDGSSKAGSAVSIVDELKVPIVYIGVGEDVADLDIFDLDDYLNALLG